MVERQRRVLRERLEQEDAPATEQIEHAGRGGIAGAHGTRARGNQRGVAVELSAEEPERGTASAAEAAVVLDDGDRGDAAQAVGQAVECGREDDLTAVRVGGRDERQVGAAERADAVRHDAPDLLRQQRRAALGAGGLGSLRRAKPLGELQVEQVDATEREQECRERQQVLSAWTPAHGPRSRRFAPPGRAGTVSC